MCRRKLTKVCRTPRRIQVARFPRSDCTRHLTGPAHEASSSKAAIKGAGRLLHYLQHRELRCLLGIALTAALLLETVRYGQELRRGRNLLEHGIWIDCNLYVQGQISGSMMIRRPTSRSSASGAPARVTCRLSWTKRRSGKLGRNLGTTTCWLRRADRLQDAMRTSARSRGQRQQRQSPALQRLLCSMRLVLISPQTRPAAAFPSPEGRPLPFVPEAWGCLAQCIRGR